jgi:hypothetical protein
MEGYSMKKTIVIEYDVVADAVSILDNELTKTETMAVLELAKVQMGMLYLQEKGVNIAVYEVDSLEEEEEDSE